VQVLDPQLHLDPLSRDDAHVAVQAPVLLPELEAALAHADSPPATEGRQRTLAAHHFAPARLDQAAHGAGNGVAGEAREAVSPGAVSARGFKLLRLQRL